LITTLGILALRIGNTTTSLSLASTDRFQFIVGQFDLAHRVLRQQGSLCETEAFTIAAILPDANDVNVHGSLLYVVECI
jgi:hypothetical protein